MPLVPQQGVPPPILASQVSRPVAVQMAKLPSQAKLDTLTSTTRTRVLQDVSQLSALSIEQLVQLCHSLHRQCEANKQILAEHVKEQGKLLKEREVLRSRKADLERTLEGPDTLSSSAARLPEISVQTPVLVSAGCAPQAFPLTAPDRVAQEAAEEAAKQAASAENTLAQTQGAEGAETAVGTAPVEQSLPGDQLGVPKAGSEQMPVTEVSSEKVENVTLASPAPFSTTGNPETACSPDGSKAAIGTTTSQAVPEEISLASPIRPALQTLQNLAVSLGSPKLENAVPEIVTLASPMQEAYHGYSAYNLGVKSPAPAEVPLQPDVASGRPLMSPGSPLVAKVTDTTSPETLSATTLVAGTPPDARKVNGVPCSGDAAAGVGAKSEQDPQDPQDPIKVPSPSYGSLDGSSVLPDCETMGQEKLLEAKQLALSTPEELMARVEDASIRLTWFFDEEMLEQLASGPAELSFQIRQQSEGVGGRLRIREHSCAAVYAAKDGAVQEQSFLVEGCAPGRPYTFSICCRLQLPGAEQQVSEFCEAVTACVPATTPGNKAPASLCSTAASVETKGTLEEPSVAAATVPVVAVAAQPVQPVAAVQPVQPVQLAPVQPVLAEQAVAEAVPPISPLPPVQAVPAVQMIQAPELPVEGSCIVPKVAEAAPPVESKLGPEACGQFLPDDGCHLRKWLQDHKDSELNRAQSRAAELTNGKVPQAEVRQASEDQSFLRQWLQSRRQAPNSSSTGGQVAARIPATEIDVTRITEQDVRLQSNPAGAVPGDWSRYTDDPASTRLQSAPAQDVRQAQMHQPNSLVQDFRHSSYAPFSTQGDLRQPGNMLGNARSKSFGGVERRQTMVPKLESRHADLSPGRGPGDGIRIVTAMTPNGHGLVAPLPAHLSHGGFCGGTPVSRQGLDPAAMGNALTTINSLPQPHSWAHGQQLQTDAFQTHGLNQQALFGQPSIVASSFFGPINDNLFGAGSSALGSTRPFSRFPPAGPASGERLFKPAAGPLSAFQEEEPRQFEPPPPPRSAPSLQYNDEPPRQEPAMPAWDEPRQGFGVTQNVNPSVPGFRSQGRKSELKVRMSDSHWESLRFSPGDDLELHGQQFVSRCGLKSAFLPGVVARLKQMAAIQQDYACVDIVDLI